MHPRVKTLAKPRFDAGHYADSVEAVFKELNTEVQALYKSIAGEELDGVGPSVGSGLAFCLLLA